MKNCKLPNGSTLLRYATKRSAEKHLAVMAGHYKPRKCKDCKLWHITEAADARA